MRNGWEAERNWVRGKEKKEKKNSSARRDRYERERNNGAPTGVTFLRPTRRSPSARVRGLSEAGGTRSRSQTQDRCVSVEDNNLESVWGLYLCVSLTKPEDAHRYGSSENPDGSRPGADGTDVICSQSLLSTLGFSKD